MIVTSMNRSEYNFKRCKLCREIAAEPTYDLTDSTIYTCRNCDFHFLNRLDDIATKIKDSIPLDDRSRRYIESRLDESVHLHQKRIGFVQKHIDLSGCKTLDIGAGLGQFQLLLQTQGAEAQGIEPSSIRREYAEEKFGIKLHRELVDSHYWQAGFRHYFDLITLWDVIEHVDFPREMLESAVKLLKPNGMLFLETPSREVLPYKLSQQLYRLGGGKISLFLPSFYSAAPYGHKQIFTHKQITGLLNNIGLRITSSKDSYSTSLLRGNKIILGSCRTIRTEAKIRRFENSF